MFGSVRKRNQFTSLVFGLVHIHFPSNLLSLEAFLNSVRRQKYRTFPRRNTLVQCSGHQIEATQCFLTGCSVSDADVYSDLASKFRESYQRKETDGILELAVSSSIMIDLKLDIEKTLIPAILNASGGSKGISASIMNGLIASTCFFTKSLNSEPLRNCSQVDVQNLSLIAQRVLLLMEALRETGDIQPDIVTYSLLYRSLSTNPEYSILADLFLEEAEKKSKKIAGGKRRKLLASARRREVSTYFGAEDRLKEILGDDFKVLVETDDFVVINKPSGIPCFHKKKTTAGKIKPGKGKNEKKKSKKKVLSDSVDISLEDALISCNVKLSTLNPESFGLVHRLDRGSSGCLVLAKSNKIHARLVAEFFIRRTTKKYVALVQEMSTSSLPEEKCGLIQNPVNGRPARSKYTILERYESFSDDECEGDAALVEFEIYTGRRHQIRVHSAEVLGSPVYGDPLYSIRDDDCNKGKMIRRDTSACIFLHARHLVIPELGINVESALPTWWQSTLSRFKRK